MAAWSQQGREVFRSSDNDEAGYAAQNALQLQNMLPERVTEPSKPRPHRILP